MLETGCAPSDEDMKKMCNFLLLATLDENAVEYNTSAYAIFQKVCNNEKQTKYNLNFFL